MKNSDIKQLVAKCSDKMSDEELLSLFENVSNKPDDPDSELWADNIHDAARVIGKNMGNTKAIELLVTAYDEYRAYYPNAFQRKADILKETCYLQIEDGKMSDAHSTMNRYLYNALGQVRFNTDFMPMRYFSFRGISDYSLKEIENEEITLAHPRDFNDPLDTILVWWLNHEIKTGGLSERDLNYRLLMKKASEHIKMRCLIGSRYRKDGKLEERKVEDLSVLMWAHYAKSHTGLCVEYDFDKSLFKSGIVTNEEQMVMIVPMEYTDALEVKGEPNMKQALFQKSNFWDYENEMRLCSYNIKEREEYPVLKCPGAIKAVYLGEKCSDVDRRKVEKAIGDKEIPLYQMSVDEKTLTRFKKTQIG